MPNFRQAYSSFSDFISRQSKVVESLRAEKSETSSLLKKEHRELVSEIISAFPSLDETSLIKLTTAAENAEKPRNFKVMVDGLLSERKAVLAQVADIESSHGKVSQLETKLSLSQSAARLAYTNLERQENAVADLETELKRFHRFNEDSKLPLTPSTLDFYSKITIARLFSNEWFEARKILKSYKTRNDRDIFDDDIRLGQLQGNVETLKAERSQHLQAQKDADANIAKINGLQSSVKTDAQILNVVHAAIEDLIFDEKFSAAILPLLAPEQAQKIATHVLKVQNFEKIHSNLEGMEKQAKSTLSQLEAPHSKLRRGAQNVPSKAIRIDLEAIDKSIQLQSARAQYATQNSSRSREAVSSYSYTGGNDDFGLMQSYLLIYMLNSSDTDPAYMHRTFGIDESVATDMNIDVDSLRPDYNGIDLPASDLSLTESFNAVSADISSQSLDVTVDVPQVDVPSFDIPSIDIPSIDYGSTTTDYGSTSSYDSPSYSSD